MINNLNYEVFNQVNSWNEFKNSLEQFYNYDYSLIGKKFEIFAKYYFLFEPTVKDDYKNVWLYKEIPDEVKTFLNITNQDYGIDLVLEDFDNNFYAVQCKFRKNEEEKLSWTKDRIGNLFGYSNKVKSYIVFANTYDIDNISKTRENFYFLNVSDLQNLDTQFFSKIFLYIKENIKQTVYVKYEPREHQKLAIEKALNHYSSNDRGQLILPCGAGKTLTALWIKEALNIKNCLILFPSLALLKQIKNDWKKHRKNNFDYLCVCSDEDIDKNESEIKTFEIDIKVTTDSNNIENFLSKNGDKVIFSTYQSVDKIIEASKNINFSFDMLICDEAHRTAGTGKTNYTMIHDDEELKVDKRLYMTATPRVATTNLKNKAKYNDDIYLYDMSDHNIFGREFYKMTFKEAIDKDILVDYQILAVGVSEEELYNFIKQRKYLTDDYSIDEIANNYALKMIMDKYGLKHSITFHSRINNAKEFTRMNEILFPKEVVAFHINGKLNAIEKTKILNKFRNAEMSTISNARCLTEGVDIPAIDLVYFCDPKNSKIDIVQASGRALRKHENKKMGYIVVPVFHKNKHKLGEEIEESIFYNLIQVIKSLSDQDERLQDEINNLAFNKKALSKIQYVDNFEDKKNIINLVNFNENKLKKHLFEQIIEKTSNDWDILYLELIEWCKNNKYYPKQDENNKLYNFIAINRVYCKKNLLSDYKIELLNKINFIWDGHEFAWDDKYNKLIEWKQKQPDPLKWPSQRSRDIIEHELGVWFLKLRADYKKGEIKQEWFEKLVAINFPFDPHLDKWDIKYKKIINFCETKQVFPNIYSTNADESKLALWFNNQIKNYQKMSDFQKEKLDELTKLKKKMELVSIGSLKKGIEILKKFIQENNRLPKQNRGSKKERNIYAWMIFRKQDFQQGKLNSKQIEALYEAGLKNYLNTKVVRNKQDWDTWLEKLKKFKEQYNKWPSNNYSKIPDEKTLSIWLNAQQTRYNGTAGGKNLSYKEYSNERYEKLKAIGYDLNKKKLQEKWIIHFEELKNFKEKYKKWPTTRNSQIREERKLERWLVVERQKYRDKEKKYLQDRYEKLKEIGYDLEIEAYRYLDEKIIQ